MTKLTRTYESLNTVANLLSYFDKIGAKYTIEGKQYHEKDGASLSFDPKSGRYLISEGVIRVKIPVDKHQKGWERTRYAKVWFEVDTHGLFSDKNVGISVICDTKYQKEIEKILQSIDTVSSEKNGQPTKEKTSCEFKDPLAASEKLFDVLKEKKYSYRIIPSAGKEQAEYYRDLEKQKDYLVSGIVVTDSGVSFEIERTYTGRLTIRAHTSDSAGKKMANDIFQTLGAEKIEVDQKRVDTFRGKRVKITDYHWSDIGGLGKQIDEIREAIEWPLRNPEALQALGIRVPKGVLLNGPPGTGKTFMAKVLASETDAYFFQASAAELTSKWYGEDEKLVKELFESAREYRPSIIFIDEIDGLFVARSGSMHEATRRMLSVFLQELDGLEEKKGTVLLAATNKYEDLDPALVRPGRFDRIIEVPLPDAAGRKQILQIHTRKMPLQDVDLEEIAGITDKYSGADIEALCQKAGYGALKAYLAKFGMKIDGIRGDALKEIRIRRTDFYKALQNGNKS